MPIDPHLVLAGFHAFVTFDQERFGFGVFLLTEYDGAEQALGVVGYPPVRFALDPTSTWGLTLPI